jgi:hypothetical protein
MTQYGKMDILWLDGGWVRPFSTIDPNISWQKTIPYDQDIDMAKIAAMGRKNQPGLLVVDRTVTGEFENYVTPEQSIPDHYMPFLGRLVQLWVQAGRMYLMTSTNRFVKSFTCWSTSWLKMVTCC